MMHNSLRLVGGSGHANVLQCCRAGIPRFGSAKVLLFDVNV